MAGSHGGAGRALGSVLILPALAMMPASVGGAADAGTPVCASPPASGEMLAGDMELGPKGNSIRVANAGSGDALVNIRHADSRKLASRFLLHAMEQVKIEGVPDGRYRVEYAFGSLLGPDCKIFTGVFRARELPGVDDLGGQGGTGPGSVSHQLPADGDGDVTIDAAAFDAE